MLRELVAGSAADSMALQHQLLQIKGRQEKSDGAFLQHAAVAQVNLSWNAETRLQQLLHAAGRQGESGGTFLQRAWYSAACKLNNEAWQHLGEVKHEQRWRKGEGKGGDTWALSNRTISV